MRRLDWVGAVGWAVVSMCAAASLFLLLVGAIRVAGAGSYSPNCRPAPSPVGTIPTPQPLPWPKP